MIVIRITNQWNKPFVTRSTRDALESNSIGSANKNSVHAKINTPTIFNCSTVHSFEIACRVKPIKVHTSHVWGCIVGYYMRMIDKGEEEEVNDGIRVN